MWKEIIAKFKSQLTGLKLSTEQHDAMVKLLTGSLNGVSEEPEAQKLSDQIEVVAKQLAELPTETPVNISLSQSGLDKDAVIKLLADFQADQAKAVTDAQAKLDSKVKLFTEAIDKAEGLTDEVKKELKEASDLISGGMSDEQVTKLAEHQINQGNRIIASSQLQGLGFGMPSGTVHISQDQQRETLALQETIHGHLKNTSSAMNGGLRLTEEKNLVPFVQLVLGEFDRINGHRLHQEKLVLSGTGTANVISDTQLPASVQREVIREALSDLRILELVQTLTDFSAQATTQIPYEQRDVSAVVGDGIVPEYGTIPKVKNSQRMDLIYVLAMKVAFEVSNELMHFSRSSQINWDAWGRNVATASRIMRELIARRLANTMQRVSDSYLAANVADENIKTQLQGSYEFKTDNFPIVTPHQQFDLQGNTVGNPENPIALTIDGSVIAAWDGSGRQAPGLYHVITSHNLSKHAVVNEAGEPNPE